MNILKNYSPIGPFSCNAHKIIPNDHIVHFYKDKMTLINAVCDFVVPGLTSKNGVILIATRESIKDLEKAFERRSIDVAKVKVLNQLKCFDAHELLNTFMEGEMPSREKFFKQMNEILQEMKSHVQIRAFGEMVNILWQDRKYSAAIELEKLWNELATQHNFSLFCGYQIDEATTPPHSLLDLCSKHSHIVSTDGTLKLIS